MYHALTCEKDENIEPILKQLDKENIEYQLQPTEVGQHLYLADETFVEPVKSFYLNYKASTQRTLSIANMKKVPLTVTVLLAVFFGALVTQLGADNREWFFIADFSYSPPQWWLYDWPQQAWFSISPIFLHFGVEHIIFNSLAFWYLSSVLERELGKPAWVAGILVLALVSNYAQLLTSGPLFGGLSGVVYGLIAFAWVYQSTVRHLFIPNGLFYLASGWLILGYTPFFTWIGMGSMANTAHLSGLLCGFAWFLIYRTIYWMKS